MAEIETRANDSRRRAEQAYLDCLFEPQTNTARAPASAGQTAGGAENDKRESVQTPTPPPSGHNGRAFAGQLIMVAGLKLVLPLTAFTGMLPCPADIDAGASTLLAGRLRYRGQAIDVVNLRPLVLPAQRLAAGPRPDREQVKVLLLQHGDAGLLCDRVGERLQIEPDRLCWREARSRRTWLAATARADGFALLDVGGIRQLLRQAHE